MPATVSSTASGVSGVASIDAEVQLTVLNTRLGQMEQEISGLRNALTGRPHESAFPDGGEIPWPVAQQLEKAVEKQVRKAP